jgi:hypothetical protein
LGLERAASSEFEQRSSVNFLATTTRVRLAGRRIESSACAQNAPEIDRVQCPVCSRDLNAIVAVHLVRSELPIQEDRSDHIRQNWAEVSRAAGHASEVFVLQQGAAPADRPNSSAHANFSLGVENRPTIYPPTAKGPT